MVCLICGWPEFYQSFDAVLAVIAIYVFCWRSAGYIRMVGFQSLGKFQSPLIDGEIACSG